MIVCKHRFDSFDEELVGEEDKHGNFWGKSKRTYRCSKCGKRKEVSKNVGKKGKEKGEPTCYISLG